MKKIFLSTMFFAFCIFFVSGVVLEIPKAIGDDEKEINSKIASANDKVMDIIINRLRGIERISGNNKAIKKEAKKLRTEAKALKKELRKIKTDEQRKATLEKSKEFSRRHDLFIDHVIEVYGEIVKKDRKEKPVKIEVKGVKEA